MDYLKPGISFLLEVPLTIWFFRHFDDDISNMQSSQRHLPVGYGAFVLLLPLYFVGPQIPFGFYLRIPYRWLVYFLILKLTTQEDAPTRLHVSLSTAFLLTIMQLYVGIARVFDIEVLYLRVFHNPLLSTILLALSESILLFVIFWGFLRFVPISRFRGISPSQLTAYLVCILGGIITRSSMLQTYKAGIKPEDHLDLFAIFFSSALYLCIVMIERYYYLEMDAVQVSQLMKSSQYELEALNLKVANDQQIRSIHHDMKNHYAALDALLEDGNVAGARDYLRALGRELQPPKVPVGTGNLLLDQLLCEKMALAEKAETSFTVDLDYRQCGFISNVDTVTIFANILDNSLEASSKAAPGDRFIRIRGGCKAGCFLCSVSNSCTGSLRFVHGIPVTTKRDALSHGYGIKNVQKVLSKYSGELNVSAEEGLFSLYLTIPLPAKE
jgi:hypothetical protein